MILLKIFSVVSVFMFYSLSFVATEAYDYIAVQFNYSKQPNLDSLTRDSFVGLEKRYSCLDFHQINKQIKNCHWVKYEYRADETSSCLTYLLTFDAIQKEPNCYIVSNSKILRCINKEFNKKINNLYFIHKIEGDLFQYIYHASEHDVNNLIVSGVGTEITSGIFYRNVSGLSKVDKNYYRYKELFYLFSKLKKKFIEQSFKEMH